MSSDKLYDVVVAGGGPAALGAASTLSRQSHTVLIIDSQQYRNDREQHVHNVLGFDHRSPKEFRDKARADIEARYPSVTFSSGKIVAARRDEKGSSGRSEFIVKLEDGSEYRGKKLIIATGITDVMPDIPGYDDCWAYGIFYCGFCQGYEQSGQDSVGCFAFGYVTSAEMLRQNTAEGVRFSRQVRIYTNGGEVFTEEEIKKALGHTNLPYVIESRKITKLELKTKGKSTVIVTVEGGEQFTEGFISGIPKAKLNGPFVEDLGLKLGSVGQIQTEGLLGQTNVPGCFAAGDIGCEVRAVTPAVNSGMCAGVGAAFDVQKDDAEQK